MTQTKSWSLASTIFSAVANPLLMPVYVATIFLFCGGILSAVMPQVKWMYIEYLFLDAVLLPLFIIWVLKQVGWVSDFELSVRGERLWPLVGVVGSYVLTILVLPDSIITLFVCRFLYASMGIALFAMGVSRWWKISLHTAGIGGAVALLTYIYVLGFGSVVPVYVFIVLAGLLASARLYLGLHNPSQVFAGFFGGFAVAYTILEFANTLLI